MLEEVAVSGMFVLFVISLPAITSVALGDRPCEDVGVNNPCRNGGECRVHQLPPAHPGRATVLCLCPPAWFGIKCDTERNFCNLGEDKCGSEFKCKRNKTNLLAGYDCGCDSKDGWQRLSESQPRCINTDKCSQLNPACYNGGTCANIPGGFRCSCKSGYHGRRCDHMVRKTRRTGGWGPWSPWRDLDVLHQQQRRRSCLHVQRMCRGDAVERRSCSGRTGCQRPRNYSNNVKRHTRRKH